MQAKHEYDLDNISTKRDLKELELRLTIKMGTMLSVAVAVIAALVKLLWRLANLIIPKPLSRNSRIDF